MSKLKNWLFQSVFGYQPGGEKEEDRVVYDPIVQELADRQEHIELLQLELASKDKEIQELKQLVSMLQNTPSIEYVDRVVREDFFTMTPAMFKKFKSQLEQPICTATTSPTQANYFLGMCRVLNHLEQEHVTSR